MIDRERSPSRGGTRSMESVIVSVWIPVGPTHRVEESSQS